MIRKKKCINCAAYEPTKEQCRRHAPPWGQSLVGPADWCLEWVQLPVEVDYKYEAKNEVD